MIYDVAIIGAGVIGGALARELAKYKLSAVLLEKESDVAMGASKANSGIVHGGFDPEPETALLYALFRKRRELISRSFMKEEFKTAFPI